MKGLDVNTLKAIETVSFMVTLSIIVICVLGGFKWKSSRTARAQVPARIAEANSHTEASKARRAKYEAQKEKAKVKKINAKARKLEAENNAARNPASTTSDDAPASDLPDGEAPADPATKDTPIASATVS